MQSSDSLDAVFSPQRKHPIGELRLGLDFGTSTTYLGRFVDPATEQLLKGGAMRSRVAFRAGAVSVFDSGLAEAVPPGYKLVRSAKRWIGSQVGDADLACIDCDGSTENCKESHTRLSPAEVDLCIEAMLSEVVLQASKVSNIDITAPNAVRMGCPAIWSTRQRERLVAIARKAGIKVEVSDLVDEAIAAGIVWVRNQPEINIEGKLLVVDMGGGTLDVAVLKVMGGGSGEVVVESSTGSAIAGDYLDRQLAAALRLRFSELGAGLDGLGTHLTELAEAAKIALSAGVVWNSNETTIGSPYFAELDGYGVEIMRAEFEAIAEQKIVAPMLSEIYGALQLALTTEKFELTQLMDVPIRPQQGVNSPTHPVIHKWLQRPMFSEVSGAAEASLLQDVKFVVLAGGMTHMPIIQQSIERALREAGNNEFRLFHGSSMIAAEDDSDTLVVQGLAAPQDYSGFNFVRPNFSLQVRAECPVHEETECHETVFEVGFEPANPVSPAYLNQRQMTASPAKRCCSEFSLYMCCVGPDGKYLTFNIAPDVLGSKAINSTLVGTVPPPPELLDRVAIDPLTLRQMGWTFSSRGDGEFRAGATNHTKLYRIATRSNLIGNPIYRDLLSPMRWHVSLEGNQTGLK